MHRAVLGSLQVVHVGTWFENGLLLRGGGEGAWESNPPGRLVTPHNGFEDRTGHRARSAPIKRGNTSVARVDWNRTTGQNRTEVE